MLRRLQAKLTHGLNRTKAKPTFVPTASQLTPVSSIRVRQPTMTTNPEIRHTFQGRLPPVACEGNRSRSPPSFAGETGQFASPCRLRTDPNRYQPRRLLPKVVRGQKGIHMVTRAAQGAKSSANGRVEERRGSLGHSAAPRLPSPLIKPDVPISSIRLSDWLHLNAIGGLALFATRLKTPSSPKIASWLKRTAPRDGALCRLTRNPRTFCTT